ncbi:hypothetical protein LCGC14_1687740 [marine sediment metagenome]|uniref:Uncharacterized protein n=1 Tax=marine sediment metagenome TaxID=412755 RepID=A0A0F9HLT9_9ZZZZ
MAMNPALELMQEANTANVLSDRLTIEYILERLSKGFQSTNLNPSGTITMGMDTSALLFAPEISIFVSSPYLTLPTLSDLWDGRTQPFQYGTRHKGLFTIKSPCVSILASSSPEWLTKSVPTDAVGGGFTRRVNFVYARKQSKYIPWITTNNTGPIRNNLINDLKEISQMHGEFQFDNLAKPIFESIYMDSKSSEFDDQATALYKTTRWVHATKLAMSISASRSSNKVISKDDMEEGGDRIEAIIKDIPIVFRAVGESDMVVAADKVLTFIEIRGYASFNEIMTACWKDIQEGDLVKVLETFKTAGILRETTRANRVLYQVIKGATP